MQYIVLFIIACFIIPFLLPLTCIILFFAFLFSIISSIVEYSKKESSNANAYTSNNTVSYNSNKSKTTNYNLANDNKTITTKIAGVTFDNRQKYLSELRIGEEIILIREPNNHYDKNAVAVYNLDKKQLGYIPKNLAFEISNKLENKCNYKCIVKHVAGGNNYNYGAAIEINFNTSID